MGSHERDGVVVLHAIKRAVGALLRHFDEYIKGRILQQCRSHGLYVLLD